MFQGLRLASGHLLFSKFKPYSYLSSSDHIFPTGLFFKAVNDPSKANFSFHFCVFDLR